MKQRELLFSLTAKDFLFTYSRGTGKGGQKRNKTETHVRCFHPSSGASGECDETRSQHKNKQIAFRRMASTSKFKEWCELEAARVTGKLRDIEERIELEMKMNIYVEAKDESNRWVEWDKRKRDK